MLDFLPDTIKSYLNKINLQCVYEIRLRANMPIMVNYLGKYHYLGWNGITNLMKNAIIASNMDIEECIFRAGEGSVYSIEEQIKKGFITAKNGERIGLAGEYIFEGGQPLAIRNFSSLCIRVPHEVLECGLSIYQVCMSGEIKNMLIISPPGLGKTTILRDLARIISEKMKLNILICDERGEISVGQLGCTCDVLKFCNKKVAFEAGIRAMRPDVIVTDEISLEDCNAIDLAINAGVRVLASAHYEDYSYLPSSYRQLFDYYVVLHTNQIGRIKKIYNKLGEEIFLGG